MGYFLRNKEKLSTLDSPLGKCVLTSITDGLDTFVLTRLDREWTDTPTQGAFYTPVTDLSTVFNDFERPYIEGYYDGLIQFGVKSGLAEQTILFITSGNCPNNRVLTNGDGLDGYFQTSVTDTNIKVVIEVQNIGGGGGATFSQTLQTTEGARAILVEMSDVKKGLFITNLATGDSVKRELQDGKTFTIPTGRELVNQRYGASENAPISLFGAWHRLLTDEEKTTLSVEVGRIADSLGLTLE